MSLPNREPMHSLCALNSPSRHLFSLSTRQISAFLFFFKRFTKNSLQKLRVPFHSLSLSLGSCRSVNQPFYRITVTIAVSCQSGEDEGLWGQSFERADSQLASFLRKTNRDFNFQEQKKKTKKKKTHNCCSCLLISYLLKRLHFS